MSPQERARTRHGPGFPRVSGDEPSSFSQPSETVTFSPRERG